MKSSFSEAWKGTPKFWGVGLPEAEALLVLTNNAACFGRSVMVESLLEGGMPRAVHPEVEDFLASAGVKAVFCGHKPCGDSPFVVRGDKVGNESPP